MSLRMSLVAVQVLAVACLWMGLADIAEASGTDCYVRVFRANFDDNQAYLGLDENNNPTCNVEQCPGTSMDCRVKIVNMPGNQVAVFCGCGSSVPAGECTLMFVGPLGNYGHVFCSSTCPQGMSCEDVMYTNGSWVLDQWGVWHYVEQAQDCLPCQ